MAWFLLAWTRAAEFSGRSRRKEYWMFQLFNTLIFFALAGMGLLIGRNDPKNLLVPLLMGYSLLSFIPALSCTVRRLHDTGRSGWWYFIGFIPLIGGIVLFVFTVLDSEPGNNLYGPNPKFGG
jgi:uncharacterized membrane protein YhaH (DUF805 family)